MKNQTPKQKAAYLVALFESIAHPTIDCDRQFAKECARRSTEQLIDCSVSYDNYNATWASQVGYWEQVKQEIDKL
jgi:hypothetical protein